MGYIGKVNIGNDNYVIGSTLYGVCSESSAADTDKVVTLADFGDLIRGVTVYVKFVNGNTATSSVRLEVGATDPINVVGNCTCNANEILAFTYEENATAPGNCWRTHTCGGVLTQSSFDSAIASLAPMKFKGVLSTKPADNAANYNNGDVIVVGNQEYIYIAADVEHSISAHWEEFGGDLSIYALNNNTATIAAVNTTNLSNFGASVSQGVLTLSLSIPTVNQTVVIPYSNNNGNNENSNP